MQSTVDSECSGKGAKISRNHVATVVYGDPRVSVKTIKTENRNVNACCNRAERGNFTAIRLGYRHHRVADKIRQSKTISMISIITVIILLVYHHNLSHHQHLTASLSKTFTTLFSHSNTAVQVNLDPFAISCVP